METNTLSEHNLRLSDPADQVVRDTGKVKVEKRYFHHFSLNRHMTSPCRVRVAKLQTPVE